MQLTGLLDPLRQTETYAALLNSLRAQQPVPDQQVLRAARPYIIAALAHDLDRPIMILTGRGDRAHDLAEQLPVWLSGQRIQRFAEPTAMFFERAPWTTTTIQSRLNTLATLVKPIGTRQESDAPPPVIVSSAHALMQKTMPVREFRAGSRALRVGGRTELEKLLRTWLQFGYEPASVVVEPGTFSRRGGIIDVFPMAAREPVRIEFFGDEIESIRTFNPATQRSTGHVEYVNITPAREALPRFAPLVAERLDEWFAAQPDPDDDVTSTLPDHELLAQGTAFPLLEFYLPHLYSHPANVLDYLPDDALIIVDDWDALQDHIADLEEQALSARQDKQDSEHLPPDVPLPYLTWPELQDELSTRPVLHLGTNPEFPVSAAATVGDLFAPGPRHGGQLRAVMDELGRLYDQGERVIAVTQQAQRIAELWSEQETYITPVTRITDLNETGQLVYVEGTLTEGWTLSTPTEHIHLLTDAEIFGWRRPEPRRRRQPRAQSPESNYADLEMGDYVVHVEYGIGHFAGLQKRMLDNSEREYLTIEYANNDLLYVPIHQADRISRYVGADDRPPQLNRLGSQDWTRTKERTRQAVEEVARELLELYATREQV
ncbi:MAG: hypothetical protein K8S97_06820, partial [Anaerolineae bacterium]|nr:hypothetical protein [Anaerolineae bacterium]